MTASASSMTTPPAPWPEQHRLMALACRVSLLEERLSSLEHRLVGGGLEAPTDDGCMESMSASLFFLLLGMATGAIVLFAAIAASMPDLAARILR